MKSVSQNKIRMVAIMLNLGELLYKNPETRKIILENAKRREEREARERKEKKEGDLQTGTGCKSCGRELQQHSKCTDSAEKSGTVPSSGEEGR